MTERYVKKRLLEMGIPVSVKGFGFILSAIMILARSDWNCDKIMLLYKKIAQEKGVTSASVERNIRYALSIAWDAYPDLLGSRRTNKEALYRLAMEFSCGN